MTDSDDGEENATKTYRTPFGTEVDRRESRLAALPGKVYSEWLDSLSRASEDSAATASNSNDTSLDSSVHPRT